MNELSELLPEFIVKKNTLPRGAPFLIYTPDMKWGMAVHLPKNLFDDKEMKTAVHAIRESFKEAKSAL